MEPWLCPECGRTVDEAICPICGHDPDPEPLREEIIKGD